jgi:hypothetical protein
MPVAELFKNGNIMRIKPPEPGAAEEEPPPQPEPSRTGTGKAGPSAAQAPEKPKLPRPKPSEKFIQSCFEPQTNQFFRMQDGFAEDGWILKQAHEAALEATKHVLGWENQRGIHNNPDTIAKLATEEDFKNSFEKWTAWFEWKFSHARWAKCSARLENLLANCLTEEQIIALVEMAWAKLPLTYHEEIRELARIRREKVLALNGKPDPENHAPTATPEIYLPELDAPDGPGEAAPAPPSKAPATDPDPAQDPAVVSYTVNAIGKMKDFKGLVAFWDSTLPAIQRTEAVKAAMIFWVSDFFMRAKYQADVDGQAAKIEALGLMTPDLKKLLEDRYAQLATF